MRTPRLPAPLLVLAVLAAVLVALPFAGLVSRVPWRALPDLLAGPLAREALRLSLLSSLAATALSLLLGVPLAYLLARHDFPGRSLLRGLVLLPLVLPPVVGGVALLFALGRGGLLGAPLEAATGIVLPFSFAGVVLAVTFISMPFLVVTVEGALRGLDGRHEAAAATLGAGRWTVLWRVTLPMVRPSLVAGVALTWARAIGEFGATLTFAGSLAGRTRTLPLAIFVALEQDRDVAIALSLLMVVLSLAVVVPLRDRWWGRAGSRP